MIVTLPEYRLSFQLKIYEMMQPQKRIGVAKRLLNVEAAKRLLNVHKWINQNVRNILDESDAILHPKYQLVYTVGDQKRPDGESLRWLVFIFI